MSGGTLFIKPVNDAFSALFEIGTNAQVVSDTVLRVTGRRLKAAIHDSASGMSEKEEKEDVLDSFMKHLRGSGIDFMVED